MESKDLNPERHTIVYARLQGTRAPAGAYVHPVGAYGVVGFSGVKDARRESFFADASASAASYGTSRHKDGKTDAERQHPDSTSIAIRRHSGRKGQRHEG